MNAKIFLFIIIASGLFISKSSNSYSQIIPDSKKEIAAILKAQEEAWNRGDFKSYMQGYWRSDSLKFLSSGRVTYGWEKTLKNYIKGYPDPETMGKLKFTIVSIDLMEENIALLIGKYHVTRKEKNNLEGYFSLIWKKINGKWVIIFDHSS